MIHLEHAIEVQAPADRVWGALWDVPRLAGYVSGVTDVAEVEPRARYRAHVAQRLGPFRVHFALDVSVEEVREPDALRVSVSGRDEHLLGLLKQTTTVFVEPRGPMHSLLRIVTDLSIAGKLGQLGQGIIVRKAEEVVAAFAQAFRKDIEQGVLGTPTTEPKTGPLSQ
jgi:carbon monoxide dehydrogenase subunit G